MTESANYDSEDQPRTSQSNDGMRWLEIAKNSTVVSTLLASIATQLLVFFKSDDNFKRLPTPQTARDVLVTWAYVALLMNILAAFAAYVIIEKFTNRPKVLGSHKWLFFFWSSSFFVGLYSLIIVTLIYIWYQESLACRVVVLLLGLLSPIPLTLIFVD